MQNLNKTNVSFKDMPHECKTLTKLRQLLNYVTEVISRHPGLGQT